MDITDAGTLRPVLDDAITGFGRLDVVGSDALAGTEHARSDPLEQLRRFAPLSASTDHTKAI
ncbi:hypothetical protein ACFWJV_35275 [Streptomyces rochei]|uniref:FXSXX-COOH protein n=1 Tax=Streptomyces rochei TaxID=1928 RepID=A0ABW7E3H3_STRRO|nr:MULTISPECIES: hypothetical protein [Streptomyces]MDI3102172.1 hypothetical protein [Streptomyces sp. AN-3]WDI22857.1 hypothetical protein PS783_36860 [Streptomyces enissocaesilis]